MIEKQVVGLSDILELIFVRKYERWIIFAFHDNVQKIWKILLTIKLPATYSDGFFHHHTNRKVVGREEKVANQGDVSALPGCLEHCAHSVGAIALEAKCSLSSVCG